MTAAALIRIDGVVKRFNDVTAVAGVDLEIGRGELFALLGGSGCGKTTLLRMLAGFETPTEGRILIDDVDVTHVPPYARPVNMMFQSYALFPHMTVARNIAYGLERERLPKAEITERVMQALDLVELRAQAQRKPHQLSGGQRQRVALARAVVKRPKVLLLDEPLAALDRKLRERTQLELAELQQRLGITFVMVTHDQDEAMTMASRIAVMDQGRIKQVGAPAEIYEQPNSCFVADFIGLANIFEGEIVGHVDGMLRISCGPLGGEISAPANGMTQAGPIAIVIRPEKLSLHTEGAGAGCVGKVRNIVYLGDESIFHVTLESGAAVQITRMNADRRDAGVIARGDAVRIAWAPEAVVVMPR
ncbi:ABC transporter ATP-binding protein [Vineibacter terrae]|uniref:ABC transporter ATP-binding protein n=1 Tax=Vineibacter terrae TaxID=2586908 RepID=UPI002E30949C|nr:ABC transporter ATP-binding protein [Vineibacter terrae]HEX2888603.1 ABC transporter ATP-binding protein [Vineibacter terrae]